MGESTDDGTEEDTTPSRAETETRREYRSSSYHEEKRERGETVSVGRNRAYVWRLIREERQGGMGEQREFVHGVTGSETRETS